MGRGEGSLGRCCHGGAGLASDVGVPRDAVFDRLATDGKGDDWTRRRFPMRRGSSPSVPTSKPSADGDNAMPDPAAIEDEIAVLRRRLAELERLSRQRGA